MESRKSPNEPRRPRKNSQKTQLTPSTFRILKPANEEAVEADKKDEFSDEERTSSPTEPEPQEQRGGPIWPYSWVLNCVTFSESPEKGDQPSQASPPAKANFKSIDSLLNKDSQPPNVTVNPSWSSALPYFPRHGPISPTSYQFQMPDSVRAPWADYASPLGPMLSNLRNLHRFSPYNLHAAFGQFLPWQRGMSMGSSRRPEMSITSPRRSPALPSMSTSPGTVSPTGPPVGVSPQYPARTPSYPAPTSSHCSSD